ncbi:hypothetical protein J1605_017272 [Eschrichtius robustus]|uniref:Uncharacterized protein n=1 Tax=Eschrichtius robustus TaxID=9764 RepID=A0AB34I3M0_ESCRO|nr:hypothetical protein J1605_017272 [Eschrichtius robustus]
MAPTWAGRWEARDPRGPGSAPADWACCLAGARPKRTQRLSAETWDLLRLPLERVSGARGGRPGARGGRWRPSDSCLQLEAERGQRDNEAGVVFAELPAPAGVPICVTSLPGATDVPRAAQDPGRATCPERAPGDPAAPAAAPFPLTVVPPPGPPGPYVLQTPSVLAGPHSCLLPTHSDSALRGKQSCYGWSSGGLTNPRQIWGPQGRSVPAREQNGDSHPAGDWRGPGRDLLPLPVRSRKYQEGPDAAERRPREGGHSPLDSADVRVQVPRTVGDFSPGAHGEPRGAPLPILHSPPGGRAGPLQGAEVMALCCPLVLSPGGHRAC